MGQRMSGLLQKAGFELGPEIRVDRCELPEPESGRASSQWNSMNMACLGHSEWRAQ